MIDETSEKDAEREFLPPTIPTVFADGIMNLSNNNEVVKFYLARMDPNITGSTGQQTNAIVQVVMPVSAFATTVVFFEDVMKNLIEAGTVNKDSVEQMRSEISQKADNGDA